MARHYDLVRNYHFHHIFRVNYMCHMLWKSMWLSQRVFQQIRERMEAILMGIVSDHWSTVT